jgi:hypothetical protein
MTLEGSFSNLLQIYQSCDVRDFVDFLHSTILCDTSIKMMRYLVK